MDRRAFLGTLALVATPLAAKAQQAGKVHRVGYLSAGARESQETSTKRSCEASSGVAGSRARI